MESSTKFPKTEETCKDHFFIFGDEKETPSFSGTHECYCKHCGKNFHKHGVDVTADLLDRNFFVKGMDPRKKEKLQHVHAWELVTGTTNKYRCKSNVTDWANSTKNIRYRIPCNKEITL